MLKRILLVIFSLVSLIVVASCGEEEYTEIGLKEEKHEGIVDAYPSPFNNPFKLGIRFKNEYSKSKEIEIYYGINPNLSNEIFFDRENTKYQDYDQMVDFRIIRCNMIVDESHNSYTFDEKLVYSIDGKLGDFLTKEEYAFSLNNKVVDEVDMSSLCGELSEDYNYLLYFAEIKTLNDDYIRYIVAPSYFDENSQQHCYDESKSYNPFAGGTAYEEVKNIKNAAVWDIRLIVVIKGNEFKLYKSR